MLNKVILIGRLGQDPLTKTFTNTSLCEMRLAVDKGRGDTKTTEWFNIKAFGELGKQCSQFLKSGRHIYVEGEFQSKEINGKKYYDVIASEVKFL